MHKNDIVYGMTIDEYCERHGISVSELIESVAIDIEILEDRCNSIGDFMLPEFDIVYKVKEKKKKHLDRLMEWVSEK